MSPCLGIFLIFIISVCITRVLACFCQHIYHNIYILIVFDHLFFTMLEVIHIILFPHRLQEREKSQDNIK